jgi:hypothetical protein
MYIQVNGFGSDWKTSERGVIQGDPLYPFIFILQMIPLGSLFRSMAEEHGVQLTSEQIHDICSFFADDTTFTTKDPSSAGDQSCG